jgi:hypothetical protein
MELEQGRRRSVVHEARWLNLLGFALRPGFGMAVDDWRVAETWRIIQGKLAHDSPQVRHELLILWRRLGGGLSAGQQSAVAERLVTAARGLHSRYALGKSRGSEVTLQPKDTNELWRLLGSLELLPVTRKVELGNLVVALLPKRKMECVRAAMVWALGRLGQRAPVYGPLNTVVPPDAAISWLEAILRDGGRQERAAHLAAMQLARFTNDRYRDLPADLRRDTAQWLHDRAADEHLMTLVRVGGALDDQEQTQVFGESLPKGLRIQ